MTENFKHFLPTSVDEVDEVDAFSDLTLLFLIVSSEKLGFIKNSVFGFSFLYFSAC